MDTPVTMTESTELGDLLLEVLPQDGPAMGNLSARQALSRAAEREIGKEEYNQIRGRALTIGTIKRGRGRSGSIALAEGIARAAVSTNALPLLLPEAKVEVEQRRKHPPRTSR